MVCFGQGDLSMKILFIYPNMIQYPKNINFGIAYLAAILKQHRHEVALIDTTFGTSDQIILNQVHRHNPDLIAMSFVSANFPYASHVASLIKKITKTPIIAGGIHPTIAPEETLQKEGFDMICVGEGEEALLELVQSLEKGVKRLDINNLWFKKDDQIIRNPLRPLIADLDALPDADFSFFDYERYLKHQKQEASFLGSRGCPYRCTYCVNHTLQQLYRHKGPFVRFRSVDRIINEVNRIISAYDIRGIEFYDDTFTMKKDRVKEFCEKFKKEVNQPFKINARVDHLNEDLVAQLAKGGCVRVSIGLESGDPLIRRKILARDISDEQIITSCKLLRKYGIGFMTYNMIGIPGENLDNVKSTIALNRFIKPDFTNAFIFTAYKGTDLYEKCKKQGILDDNIIAIDSFYSSTNVKHPLIPLKKLKHLKKWFGFYVYLPFDKKRALLDLLDRSFITNRYYSRLRSALAGWFFRHYLSKGE